MENHRQLMRWAIECAGHVLPLIGKEADYRLVQALDVAKDWEKGNVPTGVAMKASLAAHAAARQSDHPVTRLVARAIGQAVATAHMADHSLGGAFYALKAIKLANGDLEKERDWQNQRLVALPAPIRDIVRDMWYKKELDRRI